jgi:hypothetical protein
MSRPILLAGAGLWALALWLSPPSVDNLAAVCTDAMRPAVLPFQWRALSDAQRSGTASEAFTAARTLMELLPRWTDGHLVFAYRFALSGEEQVLDGGPERAARRLQAALAFLETARGQNAGREVDLLVGASYLVELAGRHHPGIGARLGDEPAVLADRYLALAEAAGAGPSVRESRLFSVPRLLAGLLRAGDRERALEVLDLALHRVPEVRDRELAAEWQQQLERVRSRLRGDRNTDLAELEADPRLEPLLPFLRQ